MKISVVTPIFKAEPFLEELCKRLKIELAKLSNDYEIILVNDASPDSSWKIIEKICSKESKVKAINFSRNFGQHLAITAGLDYAAGDWIVVMDCDLQDRPEDIKKLYEIACKKDYDVVFGQRIKRKDSFVRKMLSKVFYFVYNYFTEDKYDSSVGNLSISRKIVVKNFRKLREHSRSYPLFIRWLGFKTGFIEVSHPKRSYGKSSYNFNKLINLAIDSIVSQSNKPLMISIKFGFLLSFISIVYAIYLVMINIFYNIQVPGWTSLIVSIFFLFGLLFANMGILGLYIGKIFNETKDRPLYIIKRTIGIKFD